MLKKLLVKNESLSHCLCHGSRIMHNVDVTVTLSNVITYAQTKIYVGRLLLLFTIQNLPERHISQLQKQSSDYATVNRIIM